MTIYERFRSSSLDTAGIGLDTEPEAVSHPFTPLGAGIIGWVKPEGTHFCFLEGLGETVFAVNPGACPGQWVYPVARSFLDFLGLILACGGTEAIENAWRWSRTRFDRRLEEVRLSYKQQSILRAIRNAYSPTGIRDPYGYLSEVRQGFDGRGLRFSPELGEQGLEYPVDAGLSVSFLGGFWERGKPGKAVPIGKSFSWGGNLWQIPAVYPRKEGLVADFCVEVPPERIGAFLERLEALPQAEQESLAVSPENPWHIDPRTSLTLNGKRLPEKHGSAVIWNPLGDNDFASAAPLLAYGCDRESGWVFLRKAYSWYRQRRPALQSLTLTLQAKPVRLPSEPFQTPPVGESLVLTHPTTGKAYTLTVQDLSQEELDENFLLNHPTHYTCMVYTLSPELPEASFTLRDCGENDPAPEPVMLGGDIPDCAASIGIIGGTDGPTALFLSRPGSAQAHLHTAFSAFHYTTPETVTWRMDFKEKPWEDLTVDLLR